MLLNTGKDYAKNFMDLHGIEVKDKDGNRDDNATDIIASSLSKSYDVLFQYLCDKLTEANVTSPSTVTGAHTSGAYSGATLGKVKITIK